MSSLSNDCDTGTSSIGVSRPMGYPKRYGTMIFFDWTDGTRMGTSGPAGRLDAKRSERDKLCARMTQVSRYFGSCRKILGLTTRVGNIYPLSLCLSLRWLGIKKIPDDGKEGRARGSKGEYFLRRPLMNSPLSSLSSGSLCGD